MTDETTQAQKVRDYLVHSVESQNLDIKNKEIRRELINQFKKENPDMKAKAIESRFSKEFKKYAQASGIPASEIQAGQKKKVSSKLIDPQPQPATAPNAIPINNPYVNPNAPQPAFMQPQVNPFGVNERQVGAFLKSVFSIASAMNQDIEGLTQDEQEDLSDLWTPLAQRHITGEKTHAIFAVGGTVGLLAHKISAARKKKQDREKEEKENPNKAVIIEDSTNKTPIPTAKAPEGIDPRIGKKPDVVSEIEG